MKKDTKRRNHQEYNDSLEEAMAKELESVTKPRLSHLLVCRLVTFTVRTVIDLPSSIRWCLSALHQRVKPPVEEAESEDGKLQSHSFLISHLCLSVFYIESVNCCL